jgi:glycerol transport system ATP-binding protein
VVMHEGSVVQTGTPEELFTRPDHTVVGYFIGSPGMNVLPAEVQGHQARVAGHALALERSYGALPCGARIEVGIRPEFVHLAPPAPGLLSAKIERVDDLGRSRFARVRVDNLRIAARVPNGIAIAASAVGLVFDPAQIHVYADSRRVEGTA